MSIKTEELTVCDICGTTTGNPKSSRWYVASLPANKVKDICLGCGHQIHNTLDKLGIPHKFVCKEYSDNPSRGEIKVNVVYGGV